VNGNERKEGAFNLGRFEVPVAVTALVWLIAAAFVSIVSAPTIVPILIVVGVLLVGGTSLTFWCFSGRYSTTSPVKQTTRQRQIGMM
jgi:hypothetical protein